MKDWVPLLQESARPAPDLEDDASSSGEGDPESNLAASAVSGHAPPAGPQWVRGLAPLEPHALATTSRSVRRSMGSPCTRPRARADSTSVWATSRG